MENFVKSRGIHQGTSAIQRAGINLDDLGATDFFSAAGLEKPLYLSLLSQDRRTISNSGKGKIWKKAMLLVVCLLVAQLVIGATTAAAAPPAWGPTYHRVRCGETLSSIGRLYGVNAYAIARASGLANPNYIYAGQVLRIPTGGYYQPPTYQYPTYQRPTWGYSCYYPCYRFYPCYRSCYPYYYCWSSCYRDP